MTDILQRVKALARRYVPEGLKRAVRQLPRLNTAGRFAQMDRRFFDPDYYIRQNPDVSASGMEPFFHYENFGYSEGREARFFDNAWYLNKNPDIRHVTTDGLSHYMRVGKEEGRLARYILVRPIVEQPERLNYKRWIMLHGQPSEPAAHVQAADVKISLLMPVYNPEPDCLEATLRSVAAQTYPNWELCVADDASSDPEVRHILETWAKSEPRLKVVYRSENGHISAASNSALELVTGEYCGLLDHDDLLEPDALMHVALALKLYPNADLFYTDEDKIDDAGLRYDPYFKPAFNYELFLAQNMISHFGVYRTALVRRVGGFREGFEGAQDYDLAFRVLEASDPSRVVHIPRVLYHWRASAGSTARSLSEKSYAVDAGRRAIADHLKRMSVDAVVTRGDPRSGHYRVRYALPTKPPRVSIIIPTRDRVDFLKLSVASVLDRSTYADFEIIIVDNGSREPETFAYFNTLPQDRVKIVPHDAPFNFSELNNIGARHASGEILCLLNNDVEVETPDWLEELVSFAQRPDIGCVGARLWYPDHTLQHGGVILGIGGVAGHAHKKLSRNSIGYFARAVNHQSLSAVTGACLVVRADIYAEVGGLDEELAVAFNDVDFCLRVQKAGYRNIWTPYAEMIHHESVSRGGEITPEQQARFRKEVELMKSRWGEILMDDPAYSPNLSFEFEDFSYAWPPRKASPRCAASPLGLAVATAKLA